MMKNNSEIDVQHLKDFIALRDIEPEKYDISYMEKYADIPEIKEIKLGYKNPILVSNIIVIRSLYL